MWNLSADTWYDAATGELVADMSAPGKSVSPWYMASKIGDPISFSAIWTGDGEPTGAVGMESTSEPVGATDFDADADVVDLAALFDEGAEPNPAGTAGRKSCLLPCPAARFRFTYERDSGGEGAVLVVHCAGGDS